MAGKLSVVSSTSEVVRLTLLQALRFERQSYQGHDGYELAEYARHEPALEQLRVVTLLMMDALSMVQWEHVYGVLGIKVVEVSLYGKGIMVVEILMAFAPSQSLYHLFMTTQQILVKSM